MKLVLAVLAAISLAGCQFDSFSKSDYLHTDGRVAEVVYTPAETKGGFEPTFGGDEGVGIGPSGFGVPTGGGMQVPSSAKPEKFSVVFGWSGGKFVVETKEAYQKFKDHLGVEVDIAYYETYRMDSKGNRTLMGRVFVDAKLK